MSNNQPQELLARLDAIGASLAGSGHALALIGLGSVGVEKDRLDIYSDLDFFAIVEDGYKQAYMDDLQWLRSASPIAFAFHDTADGFKVLFEDGIFCEFAVFEMAELPSIPFAPGRVIWKQPQVDKRIAIPAKQTQAGHPKGVDWQVAEAITNLYVGMGRYLRGEKLSAVSFIQNYAVHRILELAEATENGTAAHKDPFNSERRFEARFPDLAKELPGFMQGYERSPQSALAILAFLEGHFQINAALAGQIRARCEQAGAG